MKPYFQVGGDSEREQGFVLAVARTLERHLRQTHLDFCLHRCRKRLFRCHHALSCHGRCALCQRTDVLSERQGEFAFFARHSGRPHLASNVQRLPVTLCRVDGSAAIVRSTVADFFSGPFFVGLVRSVRGRRFAERCHSGTRPGPECATSVPILSLAPFAPACSLF